MVRNSSRFVKKVINKKRKPSTYYMRTVKVSEADILELRNILNTAREDLEEAQERVNNLEMLLESAEDLLGSWEGKLHS